MKTLGREFISFLEEIFGLEFGKDLFYMRVPDIAAPCFWLVPNGGGIRLELKTNEKLKEYNYTLYYRDEEAKEVDQTMMKVDECLSHIKCIHFRHYEVYKLRLSSLPTTDDVDSEHRYIGAVNITLSVYDK